MVSTGIKTSVIAAACLALFPLSALSKEAGAQTVKGAAGGTSASANIGAEPVTIGSWNVSCDPNLQKPLGCYAQFEVRDTNRDVAVLTWTLGYNKSGALLSEVRSPIGVLIEPGLKASFGDELTYAVKYVACDLNGCLSRLTVTRELLGLLKTDPAVALSITTSEGRDITFNVTIGKTAQVMEILGQ